MKFSVIIPVYNKLPHLERSIGSVLKQTHRDFELLLIDDGSTDGSYEKLLTFTDVRVSIFKREAPGAGGYAARNLGIEKAKFDWLCFLDADDEWDEDFLTENARAIECHPSLNLLSSAWNISGGARTVSCGIHKHYLSGKFYPIDFRGFLGLSVDNASPICASVVVVRKPLILKVGSFPEGKCKSGGDIDTWLRLMAETKELGFINKLLATYYTNSVNMVTKNLEHFEVGCLVATCRLLIKEGPMEENVKLLKKFSNKYLLATIAKSIKAKSYNHSFERFFYKDVDYPKYLLIKLFRFKAIASLYRIYLSKGSFYG